MSDETPMTAEEFAKRRHAETLDGLLEQYRMFHDTVENTPVHMDEVDYTHQRILHGAIGLSTEAAELLDIFKKRLYGKQKPFTSETRDHLREEIGDAFFYLFLMMKVMGYEFEDMLADSIAKLSKRYSKGAE
jgi:NTP pyrophosphatase (non-canonical NTP hydrolase)